MQTNDSYLDGQLFSSADKMSALETLREVMNFNRSRAKDIIVDIIVLLKRMDKADATSLVMMYKKFAECESIIIDCAAKIAPYEAPKLQALEVKNEITHKFVLRAPMPVANTEEWIQQVNGQKQVTMRESEYSIIEQEEEEEEDNDHNP